MSRDKFKAMDLARAQNYVNVLPSYITRTIQSFNLNGVTLSNSKNKHVKIGYKKAYNLMTS